MRRSVGVFGAIQPSVAVVVSSFGQAARNPMPLTRRFSDFRMKPELTAITRDFERYTSHVAKFIPETHGLKSAWPASSAL
jgi:hypothetical protein